MTMRSSVVSWLSGKTGAPSLNRPVDIVFVHISQLALAIESDLSRVEEWYRSVHILELGGMTAQELVIQGSADRVIDFLHSIRRGERD
jgi:hypothetical protein